METNYFKILKNFENETILIKNQKIISYGNILDMILECAYKGISTKDTQLYTNNNLSDDELNLIQKAGINLIKPVVDDNIILLELNRVSSYANDYSSFIKTKKYFKLLGYEGMTLKQLNMFNKEYFSIILLISPKNMSKFNFDMQNYDFDASLRFLTSEQLNNIKLGSLINDKEIIDIDYI